MVLVVSLMCVTVEVSHSTNCGRTSDNTLSGRNMVCVIPVSFATTQNILFKHNIKHICDRLRENRAQRGMRRRRKKIDLVLKIVLNKPNEGNG